MNVRNTKFSRFFGIGALTLSLLGASSCGEGDGSSDGGILDQLGKQCGLTCADDGVLEGNASITGYVAVDGFFQSVVNFKSVANTVAADIKAELDGIQGAFAISADDLASAKGDLSAAITAKYKAKLVVKAQPPKCEIDAKLSLKAQADCNVKAGCDVKEGELSVSCMGTCSVDVNASGGCDGEAKLTCEVTAPAFACSGTCEGTCNVEANGSAKCDGECEGSTDAGGNCTGTCKTTASASASCSGKCEGKCTYDPGGAKCDASAKVSCDFKADAKAECKGSCDGEFTPPTVMCEADASCKASAKADAKFQAKCTPPSLTVEWTFDASVDAAAQAQFNFAIADLKVRMPRLLAATAKADLVVDAGKQLGTDGKAAVKASLSAFTSDKVDLVAKYRIGACAPKELDDSATAITMASTELNAQLKAANSVQSGFGM